MTVWEQFRRWVRERQRLDFVEEKSLEMLAEIERERKEARCGGESNQTKKGG